MLKKPNSCESFQVLKFNKGMKMKVERVEKFQPIVITLETKNDAEEFIKVLVAGSTTYTALGENLGMKLSARIKELS